MRTGTVKNVLFVAAAALLFILPHAFCENPYTPEYPLLKAYKALNYAYSNGANVTDLVPIFEKAINLYREGNSTYAKLARYVETVAMERGDAAKWWNTAMLATYSAIAVAVIAAVVLKRRSIVRSVWRLWIRLYGNWEIRVRHKEPRPKARYVNEEVLGVVLAIVIVASVFSVAYTYTTTHVIEPFSELGLLGPEGKIGNYPKTVVVGEPVKLYIYVGNHEGKVVWYVIYVKLGDKTTFVNDTVPANATVLKTFDVVLLHDQNVTLPLILTFTEPGINKRIIIELWWVNPDTMQLEYKGVWNQLWINITSP